MKNKIKTFRRIKCHKAVFHSYKAPTSTKKEKKKRKIHHPHGESL